MPCTRNGTAPSLPASSSKMRMNSPPIALRFSSGSVMPRSRSRNRSWARTCTSGTWKWWPNACSTCSASLWRMKPWSTNTQVSRSPIARCTSSAATALSTPPERPQMARWSPTCARMRSTCSSITWAAVQVGAQSHTSNRNALRRSVPKGVWITSGWNCTPYIRRSGDSIAATGAPSVSAVTAKPSGGRTTASRWLIQHCSAGRSPNRPARDVTRRRVRPNSPPPVCATSPPRA